MQFGGHTTKEFSKKVRLSAFAGYGFRDELWKWGAATEFMLGDNQKPEEHQFVRKLAQDLSALFGSEHELDGDTTRCRYSVQESAFNNPAAYIGIYNTPAA